MAAENVYNDLFIHPNVVIKGFSIKLFGRLARNREYSQVWDSTANEGNRFNGTTDQKWNSPSSIQIQRFRCEYSSGSRGNVRTVGSTW
jgi:hypothetical protein